MQEKQKKAIRWISPVLIALTALIVWRVNYEIEFMMDDEWYSTVLYADTPIRNLSDIIRAQIWHYFNWGGRSMAHGLLQLILLAGEHWADILNTGMTLLLGWLYRDPQGFKERGCEPPCTVGKKTRHQIQWSTLYRTARR